MRICSAFAAVALAALLVALPPPHRQTPPAAVREGRDTVAPSTHRPTVEAAFARESYGPGDVAALHIWTPGNRTSLQLFHAGTEHGAIAPRDVMRGTPVTTLRSVGDVRHGSTIRVPIGRWPSGVYFARLAAAEGKVGYAPFVLRPRALGEHRIAVVLPTMTWQAYNFHDDNGDGVPDTWYENQSDHSLTARLARPFENRGVPPNYKYYDQPFLRWLQAKHPDVDYLADADLDRRSTTGDRLAAAYELMVFPGHHEYVTTHEYDAVTRFRDLGGNLIFLSANDFYYRVVKDGDVMRRTARWRDVGRPEAALVGAQYFDYAERWAPWVVRRVPAARWIFAGTGLATGARFGKGGIEADETAPSSPRGTEVVADIPNIFGTHHDAQMTYYRTKKGAEVFSAGAFTLAGAVWWPHVGTIVENVWRRLARG